MEKARIIQGRQIGPADMGLIRQLLTDHPSGHRTRLSRELCQRWQWCRSDGQPKDMACRTLLLKLERAGHITLPPRQARSMNGFRKGPKVSAAHRTEEIAADLKSLVPLRIIRVSPGSDLHALFLCLLGRYHYAA